MGKRKNSKRKNTPMKKVYSQTSAKSQARQISYLNKRINKLARYNRPEVKQFIPAYANKQFSSSALSTTFATYYLKGPNQGTSDGERIGDKIIVKNVSAHLYFEYYNTATTGYHNTESSGACIRVIALQRKNSERSYDTTIDANSLVYNYSGTGTGYTAGCNAPLVPNITSMYNILYDKTRTITLQRNQIVWDINLRRVRNYEFKDANFVNNVVFVVMVTGLHADTDFTEYVNETISMKMAYTDA